MSAGKGSKPRNIFSKEFRENFDNINWKYGIKKKITKETVREKSRLSNGRNSSEYDF